MRQQQEQKPTPAQLYEAYLVPGIHARWTPLFLEYAEPDAHDHVLDVACGTGIVARHVAPRVGKSGRVVALDISADMLTVAQSLPKPRGSDIEWIEGDAASLPDGPFNLVLCQQGLQFFSNREAAVQEMRHALKAGGKAVISVWHGLERHLLYCALIEAEARYLDTPVAPLAAPFAFGEEEGLRTLLIEAGFSTVEIKSESRRVRFPSPDRFVALTLLAAAAFIPESEMSSEARSKMVEEISRQIEGTLQEYVDGESVVFPMHAHIATAYV